MKLSRLLRRNWFFHFRANLAVLLGVAVGTAVLTGALLVGDSLRGSLREQTEKRLAGARQIMLLDRFVDLSNLSADKNFPRHQRVIFMPATLVNETPQGVRRAQVNLLAVATKVWTEDESELFLVRPYSFSWRLWEAFPAFRPREPVYSTVVELPKLQPELLEVSPTVGAELGIMANGRIAYNPVTLQLPKAAAIARDSALGRKTVADLTISVPLRANVTVDALTAFNPISPDPEPRTVIANLETIQAALDVGTKVNAIVTLDPNHHGSNYDLRGKAELVDFALVLRQAHERSAGLIRRLGRSGAEALEPRDYRRRLAEATIQAADANNDKSLSKDELVAYFARRGTIDLESESLLLSPAAEKAALAVAKELNIPATSTLVFLANAISDGGNEIPYSVIAAVDPQLPSPLGPYLDPSAPPLADDEILLADWPDSPLTAKPGDTITVKYFLPESDGKATETTAQFKLRGKVPLTGVGADPFLAPEFPGITDKLTLGEWDPPFPYDNSKIKKRDEDFWDRHRATPKAYVNQTIGRKLFGSRFGNATSVRFAATSMHDAQRIHDKLLQTLDPAEFGLVFENVREKALAASQTGTDFGGLFLGFSFFLIAGALMLVSLLWKLRLEQRASEIGLLFASGFRVGTVRRLLLIEGLLVAKMGVLLGLLLAVGFCQLMLTMLALLWPDRGMASLLSLHVEPKTAIIGMAAMLILAGITIWWSLRSLRQVAPVGLLRGELHTPSAADGTNCAPPLWSAAAFGLCMVGGMAAVGAGSTLHHHEARAGAFFSAGALWLLAGLLYFRRRLRLRSTAKTSAAQSPAELGRRNVTRQQGRSLLTAGLIAFAAFLLIAVEAFRRTPAANFGDQSGGSGGFDLIATMDLPLYQDLNDADTGRKEMLDALERAYQKDPATQADRLKRAEQLLAASEFINLRFRAGDEAGCRNLARPDRPRLIGVPQRLIDRGGFSFMRLSPPQDGANPWPMLLQRNGSIPVFGENNTVQWMLKKSLGDALSIKDGRGHDVDLRIVGLLQDSIFQGELVMAEQQFLQLYPDTQGYQVVLAKAPAGRADELRSLLESAYADRGLAATPTADRLRSYLAIENTYLSTFQLLGGLGLLLGACGLAVVQLRNAVERRGELALLRALGWSTNAIGKMLRAEIAVPLMAGMAIGAVAAIFSIAPMLITGEASLRPLIWVATMLAAVVAVGTAAGSLAIRATLRAPIVPALRNE